MAPATCAALMSPKPSASCSDSALSSFSSRQQLRHRRTLHAEALQLALQHRAALDLVLRLVLLAKPCPHLVAMARTRQDSPTAPTASRATAAPICAVMISTVSLFFS